MPTDVQPTLAQFAQVLQRQAWIVLLVTIVAALSAVAFVSRQTSIYRASSKIVVGQNGGVFQAQFGSAVDPFTQTMTNLLKSDIVARTVVSDLKLRLSPKEMLRRMSVVARPNESVLEVSYDTPDRASAVPVLDEIGTVFAQLVKRRLGSGAAVGPGSTTAAAPITATVFDPPHLLPGRVSPRPAFTILLGTVLGLVLGLILAMVRDSLDRGLRSVRDAEEWFGARVVGRLPPGLRGAKASGLATTGRRTVDADLSLNLLKGNIELSKDSERGGAVVMLVTSAKPDEGKSTVVANLGVTLANAGYSVICIEADLRRPRLGHYFDLQVDGRGLYEVFEGQVSPTGALQSVPLHLTTNDGTKSRRGAASRRDGRLQVLGAGRNRGVSPSSVFSAERVRGVISSLEKAADYLIFDSPPILVAADAYPIAMAADEVLVVGRHRRTTRENAQTLSTTLAGLGAAHVAVVLTDWPIEHDYGYR
jgi:Mrp family chromosome partitioning ATPase/capsular polysaccharide biosynthesis protein